MKYSIATSPLLKPQTPTPIRTIVSFRTDGENIVQIVYNGPSRPFRWTWETKNI